MPDARCRNLCSGIRTRHFRGPQAEGLRTCLVNPASGLLLGHQPSGISHPQSPREPINTRLPLTRSAGLPTIDVRPVWHNQGCPRAGDDAGETHSGTRGRIMSVVASSQAREENARAASHPRGSSSKGSIRRSTADGSRSSGRPATRSSSRPTSSPKGTTCSGPWSATGRVGAPSWTEAPHDPAGQRPLDRPVRRARDRVGTSTPSWRGSTPSRPGGSDLGKKAEAGQDVASELLEGAELVRAGRERASGDGRRLASHPGRADSPSTGDQADRVLAALDPELAERMARVSRPRAGLTLTNKSSGSWSSASAALRRLVRDVPPLVRGRAGPAWHFQGRRGAAALCRRDGLRRALPSADPSDRPRLPQRAEQHADARPRRSRQPLGDRRSRRGTQGGPSRARHARRFRPPGRDARGRWASRSRSTSPSSARPTIPTSASTPAGSATGPTAPSSMPRTRPRSIRTSIRSTSSATTGRPLGRAARRLPVLDRPWRDDLPRRQPPHQAVPVLGLGHPGGLGPASRRDLPGRGVHPPQGDEAAGQARLLAVVQLLHLAERQVRS